MQYPERVSEDRNIEKKKKKERNYKHREKNIGEEKYYRGRTNFDQNMTRLQYPELALEKEIIAKKSEIINIGRRISETENIA